jgi:hypothetical protein
MAIYIQGTVGGVMNPLYVVFTARDGTQFNGQDATLAAVDAYGANVAEHALALLEAQDGQVTFDSAGLNARSEPS